jgi:uncharacterized membrane protein
MAADKLKVVREPRWPALVAMIAAACMYWAMPEPFSVGPGWALLAVVLVLMIPLSASYRLGRFDISRIVTFAVNGVITAGMILSLGILIYGISQHKYTPTSLLRCSVALWVTNVLVFALWYWKLDAGGPLGRETSKERRVDSSFLFPQMMQQGPDCLPEERWRPHFMDYLFLAFNTSTAFSPTDTAVLSRWAKAGMMLQALISLTIVALIAARAVNIL